MIKPPKQLKDYSIVCNEVARRNDLSARAKGIYYYIATLPEDWKLTQQELFGHFTEGKDALGKAFNELVKAGYIIKRDIKENGKFIGVEYDVLWSVNESRKNLPFPENPQCYEKNRGQNKKAVADSPFPENPESVFPKPENPKPENQELLINNILNTNIPNTKKLNIDNNISIGSENSSDSKSSTKKPKTFNEYPERIQNLIDAFIRIHNAKHPEMEQRFNSFINKDAWAKEIDLVLKDKTIDLSFNELRNIIMFAAEDSFWSANLMSLSQLRKKSKSNNMPKILNLYASYKRHPDIVARDNELDALLSRSTDNFVEAYEKEKEEMDKRIQRAKQKAERKQKAIETYDWEKFLSGEQVAKTKEEKLNKYLDDERII